MAKAVFEQNPKLDETDTLFGVVHHILEPQLADDVDELAAWNVIELDGNGRASQHRPKKRNQISQITINWR